MPAPGTTLAVFLGSCEHAFRVGELSRWYGRHAIRHAVASGVAVRLAHGIVAGRHAARDFAVLCEAAILWAPQGAALAGTTALSWRDKILERPAKVELIVPHGSHPRVPSWCAVTSASRLPVPSLVRGLPATPAGHSVIQAWAAASPTERRNVFFTAMWSGIAAATEVHAALREMPRIPQRRALEGLVRDQLEGLTSPLEQIAKRGAFAGPRFSDFEWQAVLKVRGRRRIVDALHRRAGVAVEFDGARYHSSDLARRRDIERDAELASAGYVTLRFTYADLTNRPGWCVALVTDAVNLRIAHESVRGSVPGTRVAGALRGR